MAEKSVSGSVWLTEKDYSLSKDELSSLVSQRKLFFCDNFYCSPYLATCENEIAKDVMRLLFAPHKVYTDELLDKIIDEGEERFHQKLHIQQRNAVKMACNNMFSVLTGGPGTGKTTVMKMMVFAMRRLFGNPDICFTAPTGKASRRIMESTGENAFTLHKRLALNPQKEDPDFFDGDVLFVDESSMIDTDLAAKLFRALKTGKRLVLAGDIDQLPSIGAGAVLRDMIRSKVIPVTMLTHTFRQASDSGLMSNIINIREGNTKLVQSDDFMLYNADGLSDEQIENGLVSLYCKEVQKYGKENVVILVPFRKSRVCSNSLSKAIQKIVNPTEGYTHHSTDNDVIDFRKGDLVMQLVNRTECANGDVGEITEINENLIRVSFADEEVEYSFDELDELALAYSMTIHKSQGSEYKSVILVILDQHDNMLERNLVYTGVTRAKQECHLIYQTKALKKSIETVNALERKTFLAEKLIYAREMLKLRCSV